MKTETQENPKSVVLDIQGMTCASCAVRVEKALKKVPGVADAAVNFALERAAISLRPEVAPSASELTQAVEAALKDGSLWQRYRRGTHLLS